MISSVQVYKLDYETGHVEQLASLRSQHWAFACGLIEDENGEVEFTVVGGIYITPDGDNPTNQTWIYNISSNQWREGPSLPEAISFPASSQVTVSGRY